MAVEEDGKRREKRSCWTAGGRWYSCALHSTSGVGVDEARSLDLFLIFSVQRDRTDRLSDPATVGTGCVSVRKRDTSYRPECFVFVWVSSSGSHSASFPRGVTRSFPVQSCVFTCRQVTTFIPVTVNDISTMQRSELAQ